MRGNKTALRPRRSLGNHVPIVGGITDRISVHGEGLRKLNAGISFWWTSLFSVLGAIS